MHEISIQTYLYWSIYYLHVLSFASSLCCFERLEKALNSKKGDACRHSKDVFSQSIRVWNLRIWRFLINAHENYGSCFPWNAHPCRWSQKGDKSRAVRTRRCERGPMAILRGKIWQANSVHELRREVPQPPASFLVTPTMRERRPKRGHYSGRVRRPWIDDVFGKRYGVPTGSAPRNGNMLSRVVVVFFILPRDSAHPSL